MIDVQPMSFESEYGRHLERRSFLKLALLFSSIGIVGGGCGVLARAPEGEEATLPVPTLLFLNAFCNTVIPDTDTPGAVMAGVPRFIDFIVTRAFTPDVLADFIAQLRLIELELGTRAQTSFIKLHPEGQFAALKKVDLEMMDAPDPERRSNDPFRQFESSRDNGYAPAYRLIKLLAVYGYYTSEIGATQELRYLPVPGRYDADIPMVPNERDFSNL